MKEDKAREVSFQLKWPKYAHVCVCDEKRGQRFKRGVGPSLVLLSEKQRERMSE